MKRRGLVHNFIRFPLFPGSLLIMEGACQVDWSHQVCEIFVAITLPKIYTLLIKFIIYSSTRYQKIRKLMASE